MCLRTSLVTCYGSLVTEIRRDIEANETPSRADSATLTRLRSEGASVAEFVAAGGLSSFRSLGEGREVKYLVAAIRGGQIIPVEGGAVFSELADAREEAESLSPFCDARVFKLEEVVL